MHISLTDKTALVTGAGRGIGLGIARALDQAGAQVVIASLESQQEITGAFSDFAQQPEYFQADLSEYDNCRLLLGRLQGEGLEIDILVNNAGVQFTSRTESFPCAEWQRIVNTNLSVAFYLCHLLLPHMQEKNWGRIINIASAHGLVASVNKSAYVAAKHGLVGLTKVIALENATKGVCCNAICPGMVHTNLLEKQIIQRALDMGISRDESEHQTLAEKHPSMGFVLPEQLGELAVFLCSRAAAQITGTAIPVDGGWTAR